MADATLAPERTEFQVTAAAAKRIGEIVAAENDPALMMRVAVLGGGCSGFQYSFTFDDSVQPDDRVFEHGGVKVVVDETSLELLAGAQLDYVEELIGASFQVRNPNAKSSCGCGTSFAI